MPSPTKVPPTTAGCAGWLWAVVSAGGCFQDPLTVVEVSGDSGDDDDDGDGSGAGDDDGGTGSVPADDDGAFEDATGAGDDDVGTDGTDDDDGPIPDCAGVPGGDATIDACGVCEGDDSSCLDCAGVPNGPSDLDECGVCDGPGGPCWGCTIEAASNYDPFATIDDGSCTCEPGPAQVVDQAQGSVNAGSGGQTQWQSFTPAISGGLTRIELGVSSPVDGPSPATIDFFVGEGENGPLVGSIEVTLQPVVNQMQSFDLPVAIPMDAREIYSYRLTVPAVTVGFVDLHTGDPYAAGRASFSPDYDLEFRTYVTACQ